MTPQTVAAIRIFIMLAGGFAVGHGWVTQASLDTITEPATFATICAGLAALIAAGWAIYSKRPHGIIKDAAALPQVDAVITKPKTASEIPVANVVGSLTEAARVPGVSAN
jgi:hypothetical protein